MLEYVFFASQFAQKRLGDETQYFIGLSNARPHFRGQSKAP